MNQTVDAKRKSHFYDSVIHSRFIESKVAFNLLTKKEKDTIEKTTMLYIQLSNKYDPSRNIRSSIHLLS